MIFYGGAEEGLCFDVDFLGGDMAKVTAMPPPRLHLEKEFVSLPKLHVSKNDGPTDCCTQQF